MTDIDDAMPATGLSPVRMSRARSRRNSLPWRFVTRSRTWPRCGPSPFVCHVSLCGTGQDLRYPGRRASAQGGLPAAQGRLGRVLHLGRRLVPPGDRRCGRWHPDPCVLFKSLHQRPHASADSHFCYSDFASMFDHIERLDTDVLSIESSKGSKLEMFAKSNYPRFIGPGVYDVSLRAEILTKLTRLTRSTRELSESCVKTSLMRRQSPRAAAAGDARSDCRRRQADAGRPLRRQPGLRPQDKRLEGDRGQSDQHGRGRQVGTPDLQVNGSVIDYGRALNELLSHHSTGCPSPSFSPIDTVCCMGYQHTQRRSVVQRSKANPKRVQMALAKGDSTLSGPQGLQHSSHVDLAF
jgi:hypothetical protein